MSLIPNFAQIEQQMWKMWTEINLRPKV